MEKITTPSTIMNQQIQEHPLSKYHRTSKSTTIFQQTQHLNIVSNIVPTRQQSRDIISIDLYSKVFAINSAPNH